MQPEGQGEHCKLLKCVSGAEPQPKSNFVHVYPENSKSSGNDSNDFPDKQLAKFKTV